MRIVLPLVIACGTPPNAEQPRHEPEHHAGHHGVHHGGVMPHRFEDAEQWAKVFDDPARDAWQEPDRVIAALELTPAMVVADVGAGTGYFAVRLARAVPEGRVIATDIEETLMRYLRERAAKANITNLDAVVTPADDPKLAGIDRILVVDVWHHLGDRVAFAKRLAAGLSPGGKIAIVDYKLDAKHGPPKEHRLAPDAIVADLRAAGLTAAVSPVALQEQYIVIAHR